MNYYYWIVNENTGEEDNFVDEFHYPVGSKISIGGKTYIVTDYCVCDAKVVSKEELEKWF